MTDSNMKTIDIRTDADGIALVSIDVKDRSMNVMTPEFLDDLSAAVDRITTDTAIQGAVITSAKDSFMAGADLHGLVESFDQRTDAQKRSEEHTSELQSLMRIPYAVFCL